MMTANFGNLHPMAQEQCVLAVHEGIESGSV
jgi:hypothetical protein